MDGDFVYKDVYEIGDLLEIIRRLRSEGGCPWDREQTHESIKKNLIEETYEVIEAINKQDKTLLCEELGDVLMQVVFHAQIEAEAGAFTFADVADGVCKKLIERHPHVFGEVQVSGSDEVLRNWDDIKKRSKGQKSQTETMLSVPRELPALMRAGKIQKKAAKVGFDWPEVSGAVDKLYEETSELSAAIESGSEADMVEELGDLLFSVVNVSRFVGCDAEEALTASTDKFMRRFAHMEKLAQAQGRRLEDMSLSEMDGLWDEAKLDLLSK
ncbi:MAG TPA: nucleoside triphosphate pyrophosphohydrolase [Candidatus Fimivicinus intestinavium]|nr:nucleoside triphosphate pyrophosphohydrolase [Candidatus Fimivicinus intestinavium]